MFKRLKASWMLTKACLKLLMQDKELMLFPVFCGVSTILVTAAFCFPVYQLVKADVGEDVGKLAFTALGLAYSFSVYSLVIFFNVAVLSCARIRFQGGDPSLGDGFRAGFANLGVVFSWAAVGGVVSLIMRQLEENLGFLGAIMAKMLGSAFGVISYFAIPVMIFEKKGPIDAFKRSGEIIKKTWGEALGAYLGFSIISSMVSWTVLFSVVGSIVAGITMHTWVPLEVTGVVSVLLILLASIVTSCLSQIFQAALYIYATTGEVPTELGGGYVENAFKAKKGKKFLNVDWVEVTPSRA